MGMEDGDPATPVRLAALLGVDWEEGVEKGLVGDSEDEKVLCPAAAPAPRRKRGVRVPPPSPPAEVVVSVGGPMEGVAEGVTEETLPSNEVVGKPEGELVRVAPPPPPTSMIEGVGSGVEVRVEAAAPKPPDPGEGEAVEVAVGISGVELGARGEALGLDDRVPAPPPRGV